MIELKQICKTYNHRLHVLKDITLTIEKGEKVVLVGPSGSGKSTLLRIINYLVKPDSGEVFFKQERIQDKNIDRIRENMGMVFQHFELFPHLSVLENIILAPCQLKKQSREEAIALARTLLKKVNLEDKIHAYPGQLSGGQKQRIAIVRALAMNPEVLLFDEPTSALDPEMVKEVLEVMKELAKEGLTMIIVTHEMKFAENIASRILFLDSGEIVEDSDPDTFFHHPKSERARLFLNKMQY